MNVLCYTEDEDILDADQLFRLFNIEDAAVFEGEKCRDENRLPSLKFGKTDASEKVLLLTIAGKF